MARPITFGGPQNGAPPARLQATCSSRSLDKGSDEIPGLDRF